MNPDIHSPEYQRMVADMEADRRRSAARQAELHRAAVLRRRKAKRGGKR